MNDGYIKIPRSLLNDPLWKSLPFTYRHVYLTILQHMVFKETTYDDFGVLVTLKPGELITTIRRLAELCNETDIDKSLIERALAKFEKIGFSRQTSRHRKTIVTITRKDICDLIETRIETNSRQTRDIKEESKERKKIYKKTTTMPKSEDPKVSFEIVDGVVVVVGLYKCLEKAELSLEEKLAAMKFPEDRVEKALDFALAPTTKIKSNLISTIIWHCKQTNPIPPKPLPMTEQQEIAFRFNEILRNRGYETVYEKNKNSIWENYVFRIYDGFEQSISLNNPVHEILKDLNDSILFMGSDKIIEFTA